MARLKGQVEKAEVPEPATPALPLQERISKTVEAMREAGAPESDIEEFISGQTMAAQATVGG
jgi:hypothetical protein